MDARTLRCSAVQPEASRSGRVAPRRTQLWTTSCFGRPRARGPAFGSSLASCCCCHAARCLCCCAGGVRVVAAARPRPSWLLTLFPSRSHVWYDPVFSKFFRLTALFCDETVHRRLSTAHVSTAHVSTADSVALVQTTSAALLLALASRSVLRLATPARAWRAHAVLCSSAHAQRMQCPSPHLHARAKLTCPCARS